MAHPKRLLSIIIPAYNEENTIESIVKKVLNQKYSLPFELIAVNDGSTDSTLERLKKFKSRIRTFSNSKNKGKGNAIRLGFANARGTICIIQDADLEYNPAQIPRVIQPILDSSASVVYGSRFVGRVKGMSFAFIFGNRFLTFITNALFGSHLTDMETCYKAISRDALKRLDLTENSFAVEAEITAQLLKHGYTIKEVPISYSGRTKAQGKKIKFADGIKTLFTLLKIRFA